MKSMAYFLGIFVLQEIGNIWEPDIGDSHLNTNADEEANTPNQFTIHVYDDPTQDPNHMFVQKHDLLNECKNLSGTTLPGKRPVNTAVSAFIS